MTAITIFVDDDTQKRLEAISLELGRTVQDIAECSVEESALDFYRRRNDDPARKAREVG